MMTLSDEELLHDVGIVSALYIPSIPESYFASALAGLAHTHTHSHARIKLSLALSDLIRFNYR